MFFIGQVENGIYTDDCEGIHPDIINQYYGVHGMRQVRQPNQTGAGQLPDEDVPLPELDNDEMDLDEENIQYLQDRVEESSSSNIRHEAVPVPKHSVPFENPALQATFEAAIGVAQEANLLPEGYGMREGEWEDGSYPAFEVIKSGKRGLKKLRVALPDFIWRPRAVRWVQALDLLNTMEYMTQS